MDCASRRLVAGGVFEFAVLLRRGADAFNPNCKTLEGIGPLVNDAGVSVRTLCLIQGAPES